MWNLQSDGTCAPQVRFIIFKFTNLVYIDNFQAQGNKRAMNRLTEMKRMGNKRANVARPTRQEAKDECVIS